MPNITEWIAKSFLKCRVLELDSGRYEWLFYLDCEMRGDDRGEHWWKDQFRKVSRVVWKEGVIELCVGCPSTKSLGKLLLFTQRLQVNSHYEKWKHQFHPKCITHRHIPVEGAIGCVHLFQRGTRRPQRRLLRVSGQRRHLCPRQQQYHHHHPSHTVGQVSVWW